MLFEQLEQYCLRPILFSFDGRDVMSSVHISVPLDMDELMKRFEDGDLVKMKCFLGYSYDNCWLSLRVDGIKIVSRVRVILT